MSFERQMEGIGNGQLPTMVTTRKDPEMLCGLGSCKPAFLQVFARIGAFVGWYSICGFLTSTLTIYVNSQVPMLEKQFGFSSAETGLLMSFNDIGYLSCVIFAGYLARKIHIPRGLGASTALYGISGILCALPYFMQDKSRYDLTSSSMANDSRASSNRKQVPMCLFQNESKAFSSSMCSNTASSDELEQIWIKKAAFGLMAVGFVFQGLAKSPRSAFTTLYIDDAVQKTKTGFYMGILYGVAILGPAIAYLLGGLFSKIYVTLEDVEITPRDPRWISAWWLGFLVFGSGAIIFCIPLMCFPRKFSSKKQPMADERKVSTKKIIDRSYTATPITRLLREAKQLLSAYGRVLSNPVYLVISLASCFHAVGIAGAMAFSPKYMSSQYSVPVWQANIILALSGITAAAMGSFIGGVFTRRFKMTPKVTIKLLIFLLSANIIVTIVGLFVGCDQPVLLGHDGRESRSNEGQTPVFFYNTDIACRGDCACDDDKYFPVCGNDGNSYYSPCHAGCTTQSKMLFSNCTCIPSGQAEPGLCDQGCTTRLYVYAGLNFLGGLFGASTIVPTLIAKLRCVDDKDRAVSTALSGFLTSALGWMPGPVIFGRIIDGSCLLWEYTCGERLSCQLYDIVYFRVALHVYQLACKGTGLLLFVCLYAYFRWTNKKEWQHGELVVKDLHVNGDDNTLSTERCGYDNRLQVSLTKSSNN